MPCKPRLSTLSTHPPLALSLRRTRAGGRVGPRPELHAPAGAGGAQYGREVGRRLRCQGGCAQASRVRWLLVGLNRPAHAPAVGWLEPTSACLHHLVNMHASTSSTHVPPRPSYPQSACLLSSCHCHMHLHPPIRPNMFLPPSILTSMATLKFTWHMPSPLRRP
eukprot:353145-Chlamydomonas_euryale.AAC.1